jgi:hypothetical protein
LLGSAIFDVVVLQWLDRIVGGLQKADRRLQIGRDCNGERAGAEPP